MSKNAKIFSLIVLICLCYKLIALSYLNFSYFGKENYDYMIYENERYSYLSKFSSEVEFGHYKPEWCFISSEADLQQNDLGVDLSNVDLSNVNFNKNNVLITFGCELQKIKVYKPLKSIMKKIKYVDVYAKEHNNSELYIYIIDKIEVRDNILSPKVIIID